MPPRTTIQIGTNIGKYFQNSIREDGLVSLGTHGIVFAEGKAGTIQEVFQNATQNYYSDRNKHWEVFSEQYSRRWLSFVGYPWNSVRRRQGRYDSGGLSKCHPELLFRSEQTLGSIFRTVFAKMA